MVYPLLDLSVRHNQTFVGRGLSDSQLVRCGVPTAGSVCSPQPDLCWTRALRLTVSQMWCTHCWIYLFATTRPLLDESSQTHNWSDFSVSTAGYICLSTTARPLFDKGSQILLVRCGVSTAGSVCLSTTTRPLLDKGGQTNSWSDMVCPLLDLSVCHNQTFVGQGQSDSQLVRCIVSTTGSVCLFATVRSLLDKGDQTVGQT